MDSDTFVKEKLNNVSVHGGDVYRHSIARDFSVNVNPLGMPEAVNRALVQALEHCGEYPDYEAVKLREALAKCYQLPTEFFLMGNGASELFLAIVRAIEPKKIVIPVPSFYGYEYAAKALEKRTEIIYYEMQEILDFQLDTGIYECLQEEGTLLFLANPNNPVGNLLEREFLLELLEHCHKKGIYVVLDECFLELCQDGEQYSCMKQVFDFPNLLVVRAFTKTYAIPGVRLGYLCCSDEQMRGKIKAQLPEWNVSIFAQLAGLGALQDEGREVYLSNSIMQIAKWRELFFDALVDLGCRVYLGSANYLFFKTDVSLYEKLLAEKILIRDCSNYRGLWPGFYRVAVRTEEENRYLIEKIAEAMRSK